MPRKKGGNTTAVYDTIFKNSKIKGSDGSQYIQFTLNNNHTIIAATGSMICKSGGINKADLAFDGIVAGVKKILAGETFMYSKFTGNEKNGILYLGSNFINSILVLKIPYNKQIRISRHSFLASTENIKITFTTQMRGILGIGQEEGMFLPLATCISEDHGYIWLSSYGSFEKIEIEDKDDIIVDNGMFLACNNEQNYTIESIGKSIISSYLSDEGYGMKFVGPVQIYIQTKNINDFYVIESEAPNENNSITKSIMNNMFE